MVAAGEPWKERHRAVFVLLFHCTSSETPITPLLVTLYVEQAAALAKEGRRLDDLPVSVPEVYFNFLRRVNPSAPGAANQLSDEVMMEAAIALGRVAIDADTGTPSFVPREFPASRARAALTASGCPGPAGTDPIRRLIDNGVLLERTSGPETTVRFALDPIAEYVAAYGLARSCGSDLSAWQWLVAAIETRGEGAKGFEVALHLTWQAYGDRYRWPAEAFDEPPAQDVRATIAPGLAALFDHTRLRAFLTRPFTVADLEILCADLTQKLKNRGVNLVVTLDTVGGDTLDNRAQRLIVYLHARSQLSVLIETAVEARPDVQMV
jgi:hypothetical protein